VGWAIFSSTHLVTLVKSYNPLHPPVEILGLEGESTNEKWTIFLGY
jgi:hypothetical protein